MTRTFDYNKKNSDTAFVFIGKIHSPQGIKGELFVSIFPEEAVWVEQWKTLFLSTESEEHPSQEMTIEWAREHKKQGRWGFVIRVAEIADRNQAEEMKGLKVYIPEEFLVSEEGEDIFLREVLGFEVIDRTRGSVGEVVGFSGNAMQDIVIIEGSHGPFEVPFVEPILVKIDKDNKQLQMEIPMGLVAGEEL